MSPVPNLIHPVPIEIEVLDKADIGSGTSGTFFDDDFREPVQQSARESVIIVPGQVKWGDQDQLDPTRGGVVDGASGYVLFRFVDLNAKSVTLKQNDRFIKIGLEDTDVYVIKLRPEGHYPDIGGATLIKAFFADRGPTKAAT